MRLRCAFSAHAGIKGRPNGHHGDQRLNCHQISQLCLVKIRQRSVYTARFIHKASVFL